MSSKRSAVRNRNPFAVDPLPKAYYHPTPEKSLNKAEKCISIKPSSSTEDSEVNNEEETTKINPLDEMFLRGTNMYQTKPSKPNDTDDDVNFDESWPCSERPSSVSLNGYEDDSQVQLQEYLSRIDNLIGVKPDADSNLDDESLQERRRMPGSASQGTGVTSSRDTGKPFKSKIPVKDTGQGVRSSQPQDIKPGVNTETSGSVLQRYINRFRNSAPTSREEREEKSQSASQDFWWLSNGAPPANVRERKQTGKEAGVPTHTAPLTTVNLDKYKQLQKLAEKQQFANHIPESPGDKRTIDLQERAEKLLERSSSTVLSTDPAVSTEGLGSNLSDMSSLEEYTYRPKFANYLDSATEHQKYANPPLLGQRPPPDQAGYQQLIPWSMPGQRPPSVDDPLHQWRLRRRMELAQQSTPQQVPQFDFINKTEQQKKIDEKLEEFKQRLSGRTPAHSQFTPAPVVQRQEQASLPAPTGRFHEPQIASPSLHPPRPITEPVDEVDPHLHLMCDLLPCPHRGQIQGTIHQGTKTDSKNNYQDNLDVKQKTASKSEENDKMSVYKQYLEAEKPDIDKITDDADNVNVERREPETHSGVRSIQEIENMVKDIGAEHSDDQASEKSDKEQDKLSQKSGRKGLENKDDKSSSPRSECSQKDSAGKQRNKNEKLEETEEKKENVIKPKHSSSPKTGRKGVSETIGMVVKEHLFSTSMSTVLSSVDSLPPSASVDRLAWKQKPPSHEQSHDQHKKLEHDEVPYESDEEFSEDNLLQMLRRQRSQYEQQLQEIDKMLLKLGDS